MTLRAFRREIPPNGVEVFFAFFLLTGVLIAVFFSDRFQAERNFSGVAVVQAEEQAL